MTRWLRPILVVVALAGAFCVTFVWPRQNGLDFDIDTSPRAQAAKKRLPYDLSQVRVLKTVIAKVNQNYVEPERIDQAVSKIVRELESQGESEVSSETVGEMVMEALRALDDVAYVRFASVYRNFREAKDFESVLDELTEDGKPGAAVRK